MTQNILFLLAPAIICLVVYCPYMLENSIWSCHCVSNLLLDVRSNLDQHLIPNFRFPSPSLLIIATTYFVSLVLSLNLPELSPSSSPFCLSHDRQQLCVIPHSRLTSCLLPKLSREHLVDHVAIDRPYRSLKCENCDPV